MENKIDGVTNLACDIMKTSSLPIELSGAIATDLYNKGYRKVEQGEWKKQKDGTHYCSNCGHDATQNYDYGEICGVACAFCGAHMKGE